MYFPSDLHLETAIYEHRCKQRAGPADLDDEGCERHFVV